MNALKEKLKNYLKVFKINPKTRFEPKTYSLESAYIVHSATITDNYREIKDRIQQT